MADNRIHLAQDHDKLSSSTLAESTVCPSSPPPSDNDNDPSTRVLKKGDLVRVAERREARRKNRDGGLGRIHRAIEWTSNAKDAQNGHPQHAFLYDVDFVLGGRITNVERQDLVYTTADAEGMTERRRRNPSAVVKEAEAEQAPAHKHRAPVKKPATKRKKAVKSKAATAKKARGGSGAKHKAGKGKNGKAVGKKGTAGKQPKKAKKEEDDESDSVVAVKDLYEPHRRDFEKCLARLEKQDTYGFFMGDAPPEHDEHYGSSTTIHPSAAEATTGVAEAAQSENPPTPATPSNENAVTAVVFPDAPPFNFAVIRKRMEHGRYDLDRVRQHKERSFSSSRTSPELLHPRGVHWDRFLQDVTQMCDAAIARDQDGVDGGRGTLGHAANKLKNAVVRIYEQNGRRQMKEIEQDEARHKFYNALRSMANSEAAMQGKWRKTPFPERIYERLSSNVVCAGLSPLDEQTAANELQTSLPDSFVGLSYTYTDSGQSEGWMKSVLDDADGCRGSKDKDGAADEARKAARDLASDEGVVRAQVQATMTTLLIGVQDRVMTEAEVLNQDELKSANWAGDVEDTEQSSAVIDGMETTSADSPDIVEQPVWGIDCYTRKNITMCIEKDFDSNVALEFIEKWLLPAINACPAAMAHNMINAARILEGLPLPRSTNLEEEHAEDSGDERWSHSLLGKALKLKMNRLGPPWLKSVAHQLRLAICTVGSDFFRIHPKGHGAIVLQPKLEANTLVTFYRGEVYPSWRWGEKMDAIELTQNRLELRPNLPDFYNMALERPQTDPRGYGLLFIDASRKAGHGSSLSHSCEPTCEVRVAAVNGQLRLAMTTLRELELGEELTFDYNAVTESLNEYRSAVCLCGHGRCRGSFLHFATADCYQQVLNRNSPIAIRFSNIIKGCAKQVMSEADERLLSQHGFGTAAFGAVSFRRDLTGPETSARKFDSIENVPIWLRTYVADTIRYIEYERRALPVMLVCNDLRRTEVRGHETPSSSASPKSAVKSEQEDKPAKKRKRAKDESRPIPGSKPEPVFVFFARKQRDFFRSQLDTHGLAGLSGLQLQQALTRVAGSCWKALSDEMKQHWKDQAVLEWEQNGGHEKAQLEAERLKIAIATSKKRKATVEPCDAHDKDKDRRKRKSMPSTEKEAVAQPSRISFEAADAEGVSAMEQRIQQLTQTLSRVGRVLDRHRESCPRDDNKDSIHSPLTSLSDDVVVYWLWRHEQGPVRSLLRECNSEKCVSPSLLNALEVTEKKYSAQLVVGETSNSNVSDRPATLPSPDARKKVTEALLELRGHLCNAILSMQGELRQFDLVNSRRKAKARRDAKKQRDAEKDVLSTSVVEDVRGTVSSLLDSMIDAVATRVETSNAPTVEGLVKQEGLITAIDSIGGGAIIEKEGEQIKQEQHSERKTEGDASLSPWLKHFSDRWKLEAAADLLLFYAHTNTFFAIKPYTAFESTPIEVYARELGNSVPRSVIATAHQNSKRHPGDVIVFGSKANETDRQTSATGPTGAITTESRAMDGRDSKQEADGDEAGQRKVSKSKPRVRCKPDDIITNVTISYRGDYVLSQLLQWYNGGIGQKPGLPDLAGCVLLPLMSGPWRAKMGGNKPGKNKPTRYASEVRPVLLDWLRDTRKRGNPFEGILSELFPGHKVEKTWEDAMLSCPPVGSPVLDLLVTGDDSSIRKITAALSTDIRSADQAHEPEGNGEPGPTSDSLHSTVDEGMPAQAIANWVQCENPDCLKWRKLPWNVDVDALPETFYCSDNKWNPTGNSCEAPEDKWDENDSQLKSDGIAKDSDAGMVAIEPIENESKDLARTGQFKIGARFDVLRTGKVHFSTGEVVDVDFVGSVKRVLFHFPKTQAKYDEWLEIDSARIAPLLTKQDTSKAGKGVKKKTLPQVPAKKRNVREKVETHARIGTEQKVKMEDAEAPDISKPGGDVKRKALPQALAKKRKVKVKGETHARIDAEQKVAVDDAEADLRKASGAKRPRFPMIKSDDGRKERPHLPVHPVRAHTKRAEEEQAHERSRPTEEVSECSSAYGSNMPRKSGDCSHHVPTIPASSSEIKSSCPVKSQRNDVATMRIPKKQRTETVQSSAGRSDSESVLPRIPRKTLPVPSSNTSFLASGLSNGASHLPYPVGMTSTVLNQMVRPHYFQPASIQGHNFYQYAQHGQGQAVTVPPRPDQQLLDARNYWQGQQQHTRKFSSPPSRKQYDGRR